MSVDDVLRWGWVAEQAAAIVWDHEGLLAIAARHVQIIRDSGALAELPVNLAALGVATAWIGDFARVAALIDEADSVAAATGSPHRAVHGSAARCPPGQRSRGLRTHRERDRARRGCGARGCGNPSPLGRCGPLQRPRPLRGGGVVGPAGHLQHLPAIRLDVDNGRARRGGSARSGDPELAVDALDRLATTTRPCR